MTERKSTPLHSRIFLGLALGALCGGLANAFAPADRTALDWLINRVTEPAGRIFLRLLLMTVIVLVFSSLTLAAAGMADLRRLGRVGLKTLLYTLIVSSISVVIGLAIANGLQPGKRIAPETRAMLMERYRGDAERLPPPPTTGSFIENLIPDNPFAAMAKNPPDLIGIMIFALIFGSALILIPAERSASVLSLLEGVYLTAAKIIEMIMHLAPYGVFALLFTMTARFGFGLLGSMLWYVLAVLAGLAIQQFVVYSFILKFMARVNQFEFLRKIRTVILTAFSTSSSNATLPTALRVAHEELHLPRGISHFVLTIGATANQNGTALYEGVTVLFLAQVFGVDLTLGQQAMLLVMAVLSGVGTAGVPAGSIPFVMLILNQVNIPMEGIAIILGIDRILDMSRTVLNVTGDLVAAVYISATEPAET
ncbi:MAG: dicarboxylate/amino acid:cation symporter [Bryobacterales bacterium]|nr:dicarboxylate/amino acid:cation symporter [Bryobacterales bacterium]